MHVGMANGWGDGARGNFDGRSGRTPYAEGVAWKASPDSYYYTMNQLRCLTA